MILAVSHENANDARAEIKPYVDGKTVIDVINALGPNIERNISCTNIYSGGNADEVAVGACCEGFQHRFCA